MSTSTSTSVSTSRRLPWPGAASESSAQRLLLGCGLAGPVLFIGTFLIEGATRPGYDAWRQAVSDLGLGPGGGVQRADFIVFGLLIGLFALGLRAALARGAAAFWAPLLQGVIALGLLLDGLVPAGRLHLLGDSLTFTAFPLCAFVLAARFVRVPRWRG